MSRAATATALEQAQAGFDAAAAERRRHSAQGLKDREERAQARLIEAEKNHLEEQQKTADDLDAATRRYNGAKAATIDALAVYVQAREELAIAESELGLLHPRARTLGAEIPAYSWLSRDVKNSTDLRALLDRTLKATRDGFFGRR